jgi:hypothetical protein
MQIPLWQYSNDIAYIYANDRQELGIVEQINYTNRSGYSFVQLSGHFLENELNKMAVYPKGTSNIINSPDWVSKEDDAETVALAYFNAFKSVTFTVNGTSITSALDITSAAGSGRGNIANHERNGEYLGDKLYEILNPSEMSYKVTYDFINNQKVLTVWQGIDRREEQTDNNPIVFSTKYGNIKNPNILIDNTKYKNTAIVQNKSTVNNVDVIHERAISQRAEGETSNDDKVLFVTATVNKADYLTDADFYAALDNYGSLKLNENIKTVNVDFDAIEGSYEYMEDFDIGDKCSIEIPEIGLSAEARLICCYEVIKGGVWTLSLEFGTPIIKK